MIPLLEELTGRGALDEEMADWARARRDEHGAPLDSVLLELDLVDEEGLLGALQSCFGLPAAGLDDLSRIDPGVAATAPLDRFDLAGSCPVRVEGDDLVVLVERPLPEASLVDLRALSSLRPRQLLVASHHVAVARARVYGTPVDDRTREIEAKLAGRRAAPGILDALASLAGAPSFTSAVGTVLDFAARRVEFACLLVCRDDAVRVAAARGLQEDPAERLALPEADGSLVAALRHGGYFVGPPRGTDADRTFYRALGRPLPRWTLVTHVPTAGKTVVSFHADNGPSCIATRWVAEITLLASRMGQHVSRWRTPARDEASAASVEEAFDLLFGPQTPQRSFEEAFEQLFGASAMPDDRPGEPGATGSQSLPPLPWEPPAPAFAPAEESPAREGVAVPEAGTGASRPVEEARDAPTAAERLVLDRLRSAAAQAGVTLDAFVDDLLARRGVEPVAQETGALVGELKDLFQKLATDIPAQLARGMETAFREMVPRLASAPPPVAAPPGTAPAPATAVGLVRKESAPREVQTYASRRQKTKRMKL